MKATKEVVETVYKLELTETEFVILMSSLGILPPNDTFKLANSKFEKNFDVIKDASKCHKLYDEMVNLYNSKG